MSLTRSIEYGTPTFTRVAQAGVAACREEALKEKLPITDGGCYRLLYAALGDILAAVDVETEGKLGSWHAMRALLADVAESGVEFDDARINWVTVQIDRDTWNQLQALTSTGKREPS